MVGGRGVPAYFRNGSFRPIGVICMISSANNVCLRVRCTLIYAAIYLIGEIVHFFLSSKAPYTHSNPREYISARPTKPKACATCANPMTSLT